MTDQQAKQSGYTHHGKLYGVPIYMSDNEETNVTGTNWLNDKFLSFFIWLDTAFEFNECFMILKGRKL